MNLKYFLKMFLAISYVDGGEGGGSGGDGGDPGAADSGVGGGSGGMMGSGDDAGDGGDPGGGDPSWFYGEGIAGEGDRPDWLLGKHKTVEDQAKNYTQLEKRFGGFKGAPEEYGSIEGLDDNAEINMLKATISQVGKDSNMDQGTYEKVVKSVIENVSQMREELRSQEIEDSISQIENFDNRRQALTETAQKSLTAEQFDGLNDLMTTPAGFEAIEALTTIIRGGVLPGAMGDGEHESVADITNELNNLDPSDMSGRAKTLEKLNKVPGMTGKLV